MTKMRQCKYCKYRNDLPERYASGLYGCKRSQGLVSAQSFACENYRFSLKKKWGICETLLYRWYKKTIALKVITKEEYDMLKSTENLCKNTIWELNQTKKKHKNLVTTYQEQQKTIKDLRKEIESLKEEHHE